MGIEQQLMQQAIDLSRKHLNAEGCAPFAALIVKDGSVVGQGVNQVLANHDPTAHGEVQALRDAGKNLGTWDMSGCELYTTCEPCELCVAAMHWARISKLYYANTLSDCEPMGLDLDGVRKAVRSDTHNRDIPAEQIMHDEAFAVLSQWMASDKAKTF